MKIAVWDTYVQRADGKIMHFDILVEDHNKSEVEILAFGKEYLAGKPFEVEELTSKECKFCHIERASKDQKFMIYKNGYSIIEMENCT